MHLYHPETGEYNIPFVRDVLSGREAVVITLGFWEEGLMVQCGNLMGIRTVADLVQAGGTIVNREPGVKVFHALIPISNHLCTQAQRCSKLCCKVKRSLPLHATIRFS